MNKGVAVAATAAVGQAPVPAAPRLSNVQPEEMALAEAVCEFALQHRRAANALGTLRSLAASMLPPSDLPRVALSSTLLKYCMTTSQDLGELVENSKPAMLAPAVAQLLATRQSTFEEACFAMAGPHIHLVASIKSATAASIRGLRSGSDAQNRLLNDALHAVNAVNYSWRFLQQYAHNLSAVVVAVPPAHPARHRLDRTQAVYSGIVAQSAAFSELARMKVSEDTFKQKLVVPKSKAFRNVTTEGIFACGPILRSEVVFRLKSKGVAKTQKIQPLRLTVIGKVVMLTVSTLEAETLAALPTTVAEAEARFSASTPDTVFTLLLRPGLEAKLRCKTASQRDQWVQFFSNSREEVPRLLRESAAFRAELAGSASDSAAAEVAAAFAAAGSGAGDLCLLAHRHMQRAAASSPAAAAWGTVGDPKDAAALPGYMGSARAAGERSSLGTPTTPQTPATPSLLGSDVLDANEQEQLDLAMALSASLDLVDNPAGAGASETSHEAEGDVQDDTTWSPAEHSPAANDPWTPQPAVSNATTTFDLVAGAVPTTQVVIERSVSPLPPSGSRLTLAAPGPSATNTRATFNQPPPAFDANFGSAKAKAALAREHTPQASPQGVRRIQITPIRTVSQMDMGTVA